MASDSSKNDTRAGRLKQIVANLLEQGLTPTEIELDGLYVCVVPTAQVSAVEARSAVSQTPSPQPPHQSPPVRSYRQQARDELRLKIAGAANGGVTS